MDLSKLKTLMKNIKQSEELLNDIINTLEQEHNNIIVKPQNIKWNSIYNEYIDNDKNVWDTDDEQSTEGNPVFNNIIGKIENNIFVANN